MRVIKRLALAVLFIVLAVSCGGDGSDAGQDGDPPNPGASNGELIVQIASYDVSVGEEQRVILGLLTPDQLFVSYGTVDVEYFFLGKEQGEGTAQEGPTATGEFLAIPGEGSAPADRSQTIVAPASRGRGVYSTEVEFDRAGYWMAQATADVEDGPLTGNTVFEVHEKPVYPAVGEPAPKTDNLTLSSKDAPKAAVDSRAGGGEIPDAELHRMTISESIARKEPALVVFATPVYCVSRFCGPITDMIAELAEKYSTRANFIHVEIWRNFEKQVVNKGAADWVLRGDLTEPWVYLIGADGEIEARWDNVATAEELESYLTKLPPL